MDEREARLGRNETVFREVNERLKELGESFSLVSERADFVCECGNASCVEPILMTLGEYERLRSNPAWFAIREGHDFPDVETVIETRDGYAIVEKHPGGPAQLAEQQDPRA